MRANTNPGSAAVNKNPIVESTKPDSSSHAAIENQIRGIENLKAEFEKFQKRLRQICGKYLIQVDGDRNMRAGDLFRSLSPVAKETVKRLMALAVQLDKKEFIRDVLSNGLFFKTVRKEVNALLPEISKSKETEIFCADLVDALLELGEFTSNSNAFCLRAMHTLEQSKKKEQNGLQALLVKHEEVTTQNELLQQSVLNLTVNETQLKEREKQLNQTVADLHDQINRSKSMSVANQSVARGKENANISTLNTTQMRARLFANVAQRPQPQQGTSDFRKLCGIVCPTRVRVIEELRDFRTRMHKKNEEFLFNAKENDLELTSSSTFVKASELAYEIMKQILLHNINGKNLEVIFSMCELGTAPMKELKSSLDKFKAEENFAEEADKLSDNIRANLNAGDKSKSETEVREDVVKTLYQLFNSQKEDRFFEPDPKFAAECKALYTELSKQLKQERSSAQAKGEQCVK